MPRNVYVTKTGPDLAVGIGAGIRLIGFNEQSGRAALQQLLDHGRITLPNAATLDVPPDRSSR
jgi:hypothetical protein